MRPWLPLFLSLLICLCVFQPLNMFRLSGAECGPQPWTCFPESITVPSFFKSPFTDELSETPSRTSCLKQHLFSHICLTSITRFHFPLWQFHYLYDVSICVIVCFYPRRLDMWGQGPLLLQYYMISPGPTRTPDMLVALDKYLLNFECIDVPTKLWS